MSFVRQNDLPDPSISDYPRPPPGEPTGIKVIIVGAGIAGLGCAIECRMVGHEVLVFEAAKEFLPLGDNIGLFPNSGRLVKRWGIHHELLNFCSFTPGLHIYRYDGQHIVDQMPRARDAGKPEGPDPFKDAPLYDTQRSDLHRIMLDRARELGATVRQGERVIKYIEGPDSASVDVDGVTYTANVVIGADGVKSKARELVLGFYDAPKSSGYAIFRCSYSAELIRASPECAHLAVKGVDARSLWIGPDAHFIHGTSRHGEHIHWLFTHLDKADVEESWVYPAQPEDALEYLKGWDPVCGAVVKTTPPGTLIDWKLVFRDPLPTWVSKGGLIAVIGDSAHPFLPTSQQGASQAVEDGVTVAHVLKLAKERGHPLNLALKIYQALRYERVRKAQQLGVDNRNMWHKLDYTKPINPEEVKLPFAMWLWDHDAAIYANEHFDEVIADLSITSKSPEPAQVEPVHVGSAQVINAAATPAVQSVAALEA